MTTFTRQELIVFSWGRTSVFWVWSAFFYFSASASAGLLPNQYPMQDQALEVSGIFLQAIDQNDSEVITKLLGPEILSENNLPHLLSSFSKIKSSLGGAASRRVVIDLETKNPQRGYGSNMYLIVKYRSIYPRGSVSEWVSMSIDPAVNKWRVVGWWAGPSKYD